MHRCQLNIPLRKGAHDDFRRLPKSSIFVFYYELGKCPARLFHLWQRMLVFHLLRLCKISFEHKFMCCPSAVEWIKKIVG